MSSIRNNLGNYFPRTGKLPKHGLTLHDMGELIRRAGMGAGFIPESEYKVYDHRTRQHIGKIDWVWLDPGNIERPVVAFEIEGQDVDPRSIEADIEKFQNCGALSNVFVLFQVDHNRTRKPKPPMNMNPKKRVMEHLKGLATRVYLDRDLMMRNGIERLQLHAKQLAQQHAAK